VPPTLLISSLGIVPDVRKCQTLDFKMPGDLIYIIGVTKAEMGGSEYFAYLGERERNERYVGNIVPRVDLGMAKARYSRMSQAIDQEIFSTVLPVGVGGIGFGLAKMAMASELGAEIDLGIVPSDQDLKVAEILFSESQSRFIVTVPSEKTKKFEDVFGYEDFAIIGKVVKEPELIFKMGRDDLGRVPVADLKQNYKKTLGW
jgi:phosphoribosylformylglycinamidine synthase